MRRIFSVKTFKNERRGGNDMRKNIKKIAAVCLSAVVLTSVPAVTMAATAVEPVTQQVESGIVPYMLYIVDARCTLTVSGTTATVDAWVEGDSFDATKAKVVAELQEKNGSSWTTIATWTDTQNGSYASVYKTKAITSGNTYRVKAAVTVWEGTASETRTLYSS